MNTIAFIGMDVHTSSYTLCVYDEVTQDAKHVVRTEADPLNVLKYISNLRYRYYEPGTEFICGYEAGCLGYSLYRYLEGHNQRCVILAPSTMHREQSRPIKNDRRDAKLIAQCLAHGTYKAVYVPDEKDDAVKEYIRMRTDHKDALKKIKQQILALTARLGHQYAKGNYWTQAHLKWLRSLQLGGVYQETLLEYLATYDRLSEAIERFDARIEELAEDDRYRENVKKLVCFKGVRTHTALSLLVETGDFNRFEKAGQFAAYLGLVPGQHDSGGHGKNCGITKTGNKHLRTLLVEAAQGFSHGRPGSKGRVLKARQAGNPPDVLEYADRANERLRRKYGRLTAMSLKRSNVAKAAVARELACFIWGMMTGRLERRLS